MTSTTAADRGLDIDPRAGRIGTATLVFLAAVSGPVAMWWVGFQVDLPIVLAVSLVATGFTQTRIGTPRLPRLAAGLVAAGIVAATTGIVVGARLAVGFVLADWILRGLPPLARLRPLPPRATIPAMALFLPTYLLPNARYDSVPAVLSVAFAMVLIAGWPGSSRWRERCVVGASGLYLVGALVLPPELNAVPSLVLATTSGTVLALLSTSGEAGRWRLQGPLVLALPAMTWAMVGIGLYATGLVMSDSLGYGAWRTGVSQLGPGFHQVLALTGVPSFVLGLLAIGAAVALDGVDPLRRVGRAGFLASTSALAIGVAWSVQLPSG